MDVGLAAAQTLVLEKISRALDDWTYFESIFSQGTELLIQC